MKEISITLLELMVVVVIVGILATLGLPMFTNIREKAFDEEAKISLKQMQAAEKMYRMELGEYYPGAGEASETNVVNINANLKLVLSETNWDYLCQGNNTGCVQATRIGGDSRNWRMLISEDDPVKGSTCP